VSFEARGSSPGVLVYADSTSTQASSRTNRLCLCAAVGSQLARARGVSVVASPSTTTQQLILIPSGFGDTIVVRFTSSEHLWERFVILTDNASILLGLNPCQPQLSGRNTKWLWRRRKYCAVKAALNWRSNFCETEAYALISELALKVRLASTAWNRHPL
jgi:hypothetical protein